MKANDYVPTPGFYPKLYPLVYRNYAGLGVRKLESLLKETIKGSLKALKRMKQIKSVTVNGLTLVFTLEKDFEYYLGKQSLTSYLKSFKSNAKVSIF